MKKTVFVFLLLYTGITIYGQNNLRQKPSAGIGFVFTDDFKGDIGTNINNSITVENVPLNMVNFGIYAYGDFVYVELVCGFLYGFGIANQSIENLWFLCSDLGIYGKYPFSITSKIDVYPLLGFEYQPVLLAKINNSDFKDNHIKWNQYWFKFGTGLIFNINNYVNIRFEALYGLRIKNKKENFTENDKLVMFNNALGNGLTLRIAVGL